MIFPETRILSIDFGIKRIGLALSDPLKIFGYPYKTLENNNQFWNELKNLIREKGITKIIMGFPDEENKSTNNVRQKILALKVQIEKLDIEVVLWDESYTSVIARQKIIESVTKKSKRRDKGLLDRNSAAIILQEYLDKEK